MRWHFGNSDTRSYQSAWKEGVTMPQKTDNSIESVGSSYLLWTGWHTTLTQLTFAPESPEWYTWLGEIPSFRFKSKRGKYTARKEQRAQGGDYWIAYVKHS